MKRVLLGATLAFGLFSMGCGSGSSGADTSASTTTAGTTPTTVVKADSAPPAAPESPSLRAFEAQTTAEPSPRPNGSPTVPPSPPSGTPGPAASPSTYTVPLRPGWNPVALQCSRVLSMQKPPEVLGCAWYDGSNYPTSPLDPERTNGDDEGPRRGLWVFATSVCNLTYTGIDDNRGDFLKLRRGWNLVSFVQASRINAGAIIAMVTSQEGLRQVPLSSVVLPKFYEIQDDGGQLSVDLVEGSQLEPRHCYWVFAGQACLLSWGRPPVVEPSPGASPRPLPSPGASPRPEPSPSVKPSPRPEPSPKPSPDGSPRVYPSPYPYPSPSPKV